MYTALEVLLAYRGYEFGLTNKCKKIVGEEHCIIDD
jgi:hypothetical protein